MPIKEQTVIGYILDAAREGREMDWSRFCREVGLTPEIASGIRLAIAKVGSREKLKPIKDELSENVILPPLHDHYISVCDLVLLKINAIATLIKHRP